MLTIEKLQKSPKKARYLVGAVIEYQSDNDHVRQGTVESVVRTTMFQEGKKGSIWTCFIRDC